MRHPVLIWDWEAYVIVPSTVTRSAAAASAATDWTRELQWTTRNARWSPARRMSRRVADPRRRRADLTGFPAATATSATATTSDVYRAWRRLAPGRLLADSGTTTTWTRRHNAPYFGSVRTKHTWFIRLRHESSATATVILRSPPDAVWKCYIVNLCLLKRELYNNLWYATFTLPKYFQYSHLKILRVLQIPFQMLHKYFRSIDS